jgi:aryl-alcohol dehydrogenase-like predicted oxidoreductase
MAVIGKSDLVVFPLGLGGNTFGWTSDKETSFAVLDGYVAGGGNFVDTADSSGAGFSPELRSAKDASADIHLVHLDHLYAD